MTMALDLKNAVHGVSMKEADTFGRRLFHLIIKADPINRNLLRMAFPEYVAYYELWMSQPDPERFGFGQAALDEWMAKIVLRSGDKIEESRIFMSLFTKDFKKNPRCALELGLALLMNKPIVLIVPTGEPVPAPLINIAAAVEYFRPDDPAGVADASMRAFKKVVG